MTCQKWKLANSRVPTGHAQELVLDVHTLQLISSARGIGEELQLLDVDEVGV
jgi:hypothetical protein